MLSSLRKLVFHNYVSIFLILYRYLETEHIRHCVPSNVSSGLATLPLKYVWLDGKENKSWPTNPTLPTGELLNGSQAYLNILSYFTTNSTTPLEVSNLGLSMCCLFITNFQTVRRSKISRVHNLYYCSTRNYLRFWVA